jgi:hypothetical protein
MSVIQNLGIKGLSTSAKRELIKELKEAVRLEMAFQRDLKVAAKVLKAQNAQVRKEVAIAKARAKLEKLLAPVGSKALKANRKPSKGIVVSGAVQV